MSSLTNKGEINWFNDFYSDMCSLDFDSLFPLLTLEVSRILILTQLIDNRTFSGVIMLVISNKLPDYFLNYTPLSPITITDYANY